MTDCEQRELLLVLMVVELTIGVDWNATVSRSTRTDDGDDNGRLCGDGTRRFAVAGDGERCDGDGDDDDDAPTVDDATNDDGPDVTVRMCRNGWCDATMRQRAGAGDAPVIDACGDGGDAPV